MVIYPLLACLACKWLQIGTAMLLIITSTDDELLKNVNIGDLDPKNIYFLGIFSCKRVNCDEVGGDRPRLPANRNCHRLSHVSWALAQISCLCFQYEFLCIVFVKQITFGCYQSSVILSYSAVNPNNLENQKQQSIVCMFSQEFWKSASYRWFM